MSRFRHQKAPAKSSFFTSPTSEPPSPPPTFASAATVLAEAIAPEPPSQPFFFKLLNPGFVEGINISPYFSEYTGTEGFYGEAQLVRRGGRKWKVRIEGGRIGDGWKKFAEENHLECGDMLRFQLNFDRNEREMAFEVTVLENAAQIGIFPGAADYSSDCVPVHPSEKGKVKVLDGGSTCDDDDVFTATYVEITQSHLVLGLNLPMCFVRPNNLFEKDQLCFVDDEQKRWSMKLTHESHRVRTRRAGWVDFVQAKHLREGALLKLKLVENGEVPKVHVTVVENGEVPKVHDTVENGEVLELVENGEVPKVHVTVVENGVVPKVHDTVENGEVLELVENGEVRKVHVTLEVPSLITSSSEVIPTQIGFFPSDQEAADDTPERVPVHSSVKGKVKILDGGSKCDGVITAVSVEITQSHLSLGLNLPMCFARPNGFLEKDQVCLVDDEQNTWSINLVREKSRVRTGRLGWANFVQAKDLKEGAVLELKLVENGEVPKLLATVRDPSSSTGSFNRKKRKAV